MRTAASASNKLNVKYSLRDFQAYNTLDRSMSSESAGAGDASGLGPPAALNLARVGDTSGGSSVGRPLALSSSLLRPLGPMVTADSKPETPSKVRLSQPHLAPRAHLCAARCPRIAPRKQRAAPRPLAALRATPPTATPSSTNHHTSNRHSLTHAGRERSKALGFAPLAAGERPEREPTASDAEAQRKR